MITQLETELDRSRRIRHAPRVAYAAACLLRECGYRVTTQRKKPGQRAGRCWLYQVEGERDTIIGQEAMRNWLWDHGIKVPVATFSRAMNKGKGAGKFGQFIVRQVGMSEKLAHVDLNRGAA